MLQRMYARSRHWPYTRQAFRTLTQMLTSPCAVQHPHLSCFRVGSQPANAAKPNIIAGSLLLRVHCTHGRNRHQADPMHCAVQP